MDFTEFVLSHLPPAPARVLDVGCGDVGGVVPALVEAGYDAYGVDPRAPAGTRYSHGDFRDVDGGLTTRSSPGASCTTSIRSTKGSTGSPRSRRC